MFWSLLAGFSPEEMEKDLEANQGEFLGKKKKNNKRRRIKKMYLYSKIMDLDCIIF